MVVCMQYRENSEWFTGVSLLSLCSFRCVFFVYMEVEVWTVTSVILERRIWLWCWRMEPLQPVNSSMLGQADGRGSPIDLESRLGVNFAEVSWLFAANIGITSWNKGFHCSDISATCGAWGYARAMASSSSHDLDVLSTVDSYCPLKVGRKSLWYVCWSSSGSHAVKKKNDWNFWLDLVLGYWEVDDNLLLSSFLPILSGTFKYSSLPVFQII